MNCGPKWTTTSACGQISVNQLQNWAPMLREGLDAPDSWGYGTRRLTVKDKDGHCPMAFSAMGYRDQKGKWFIGLRMNVDQVSPIKFKEWNDGDNILPILTELMTLHLEEYGCSGNYGVVV